MILTLQPNGFSSYQIRVVIKYLLVMKGNCDICDIFEVLRDLEFLFQGDVVNQAQMTKMKRCLIQASNRNFNEILRKTNWIHLNFIY